MSTSPTAKPTPPFPAASTSRTLTTEQAIELLAERRARGPVAEEDGGAEGAGEEEGAAKKKPAAKKAAAKKAAANDNA